MVLEDITAGDEETAVAVMPRLDALRATSGAGLSGGSRVSPECGPACTPTSGAPAHPIRCELRALGSKRVIPALASGRRVVRGRSLGAMRQPAVSCCG
ncbi:hypothetical protein AB0D24_23450 [Streptomyces javensis]|uniref:hypothetical protein n=1 Tax=Streptomyces javensis TaxID=114698 RepID=UPI0033CA0E11